MESSRSWASIGSEGAALTGAVSAFQGRGRIGSGSPVNTKRRRAGRMGEIASCSRTLVNRQWVPVARAGEGKWPGTKVAHALVGILRRGTVLVSR